MVDEHFYFCFTLSGGQVEFLRSKKYKIDRMDCFMSLVGLAARESEFVQLSKTQQLEILPGQVAIDNSRLARLWGMDRKTVPKLIEAMEALGISSSQKVGDVRVHTLHSLSGWYVNGRLVKNQFASKPNAGGSGIFHAEVPPPRVVAIEAEDTKCPDTEMAAMGSGKSRSYGVRKYSQPSCSPSLISSGIIGADKVGEFNCCSDSSVTSEVKTSRPSGSNTPDTKVPLEKAYCAKAGRQDSSKAVESNTGCQSTSAEAGNAAPGKAYTNV